MMPISTPNVWELRADPGRIRASARAWHALGDAVQLAQSLVDGEIRASLGTGWTGNAADTYHEHRGRMVRAGADVTDAATEVGKALNQIADLLQSAGDRLSTSLRDLTTKLANDQVTVDKVGDELVFQTRLPPHDDAVLAEISYARQLHSRLHFDLYAPLSRIQAQHWAFGNTDRREREAARARLQIIPNGPGSTFVRDVNACLDTIDRPGGDPEGIMPTVYDPTKTVVIRESIANGLPLIDDKSFVYWNPFDSEPDWATVHMYWNPDPDNPEKNAASCGTLYHELYHVYDGFQQTRDDTRCGDTGIWSHEVKASFAKDAYLRAQLGPSWDLDDEGNWVERPHVQYYGGKRLPLSIDECYEPSNEDLLGGGGANSGEGGAEGAAGVGGTGGPR